MRTTANITVRSHGFTVTDYNDDFYKAMCKYAATLLDHKLESIMVNGKRVLVKKPDRVFAASTATRKEMRFHINCLAAFKSHMQNCGWHPGRFKMIDDLPGDGVNTVFDFLTPNIGPNSDAQKEWIDYQLTPDPSGISTKINNARTGMGKEQPLSAKIKIPGGWSTMGDMYVGKTISDPHGKPQKVIGVFPQGLKQTYRITFADGRYTRCGIEHLWKVFDGKCRDVDNRWSVINTQDIINELNKNQHRLYVQLPEADNSVYSAHYIDPYSLGVLLGDGGFSGGMLTLHNPEDFIINEIRNNLPLTMDMVQADDVTWRLKNKQYNNQKTQWMNELTRMNLWGCRAWEKVIPEEYMIGTREQIVDLLQGLMDTDGYISEHSSCSFTTTSRKMAEQVQYLVRSIGGIASIAEKAKHFTYKGERKLGRPAYQVNIRHSKPSELFRLPRKKERANDNGQYCKDLKLRIVSVVPDIMEECQCIMVDSPEHLYVTDDFIVTHNTFMAIYNMVKLGKRTVITISPKYLQTWLDGIAKFVRVSPDDICVVRGSDEVNGLMKQAKNDTLKAKIIIISLQTYQYFMSEYEDNSGVMTHYDHTPDEFWKILNPGFLIVDEGHESIHALFKYDLYLNIRNKLICTATLEADSAFINEMYRVIYPLKWRFKQGTYDKYIESVAVMYGLKSSKQMKYKGFGGTYSHVKLEQSIMKKDHHIAEYMRFINGLVDFFYIKVMKPGMKLLIYCATVDMCVIVTDYLERFYRAQGLSVSKYTQEDPTSALYDNDIVVSTLKSAGTGVDIPGLRTVIMTVAVGSMQINIQSLGRLRELKMFPGVTPSFIYTCCTDIAPHMQYHRKKLQIFADKTLSQRTMNSGFSL